MNRLNLFTTGHDFRYYLQLPKYIYQRAKYGLCDRDIWDLDGSISAYISNGLNQLAETSHCYPGEMNSYEEWADTLRDLAKVWDKLADCDAYEFTKENWEETLNEYLRDKKKAFETLAKHFGDLWD